MNDELERMWMEVVINSFKVLSWHLPEEADETVQMQYTIANQE
jgi:hypothetical protein